MRNIRYGILVFLFLFVFAANSFAKPGIKITEPQDNAVFQPGQDMVIRVESVEGFQTHAGGVLVGQAIGGAFIGDFKFNSLPASFTVKIPDAPRDPAFRIIASAEESFGATVSDYINISIQPSATLQSFDFGDFNTAHFEADWNGVPKPDQKESITVQGLYSDGITRYIPVNQLTFTSSDSSIVTVDAAGHLTPLKVGKAYITVSKGDVSGKFNVEVNYPRGQRPSELIPPTTTIDIQPPANTAGWCNQDLTINLSAQDNPGGTGVQEIDYHLADSANAVHVQGDSATLTYTLEGQNSFSYWSVDKARNHDMNRINLNLDKTLPVTTYTIDPAPGADGIVRSLPVKVKFAAKDNLSGVAFTTPDVTIDQAGERTIEYYSKDLADNVEPTKTLTVKVAPQDTTPPQVSIGASPAMLWPPNGKMVDVKITGAAKDALSGIDHVEFKVVDEYGKCQPVISGFGATIKLEASREGSDKDGRVYTIFATAFDKAGNKATAFTKVVCPHDQGK